MGATLVAAAWAIVLQDGLRPPAWDARALGRSGTNLAIGDTGLSMLQNPAGIAQFYGHRLDVVPALYLSTPAYRDPRNPKDLHSRATSFPFINAAVVIDPYALGASWGQPQGRQPPQRRRTYASDPWADLVAPPPPRDATRFLFGLGFFVQSGAGADFTIATSLFPEGTRHFSNFSFLTLTPTLAVDIQDRLFLAGSFQVNYGMLDYELPDTQPSSIMKGPLFPAGSLESAFGSFFGLPTEFGPAMDEAFAQPHDPPAASHAAKPLDPSFSRNQGLSRLQGLRSLGIGGRLGLLVRATDRLRLGFAFGPRSRMSPWRGKARIDFNRQIQAFVASPSVGHSGEDPATGLELRFNFDQVWNQGVVDLYASNALVSTVAMPGGSIVGNLPNGGAGGFAADYDIEIEQFDMPMDVGIGGAYDITDRWVVGLDLRRIFWSRTMDTFRIRLTNGSNPDVNALIGGNTLRVTFPLHWRDQNVMNLGTEYRAFDWLSLRAGASYRNNPASAETITPILPVTTEWVLGGGFSVYYGRFAVDAGVAFGLPKTTHVGRSLKSPDLEGATFTSRATMIQVGLTARW